MSAAASCPHVYRAINRITAEFTKSGIAKAHVNLIDKYEYRSIDDLTGRLGPLLARHRLCVLPRVLRRECSDRVGEMDSILQNVRLLVAFDLVSARDGTRHTVKAWGEALDVSDKGTAKAMSSAFKHAMLQLFCVPVPSDDADAQSPKLARPPARTEPAEGWQAWAQDTTGMIKDCESQTALDQLRIGRAGLLGALRREQPALYRAIGEQFAARSTELARGELPIEAIAAKNPTVSIPQVTADA